MNSSEMMSPFDAAEILDLLNREHEGFPLTIGERAKLEARSVWCDAMMDWQAACNELHIEAELMTALIGEMTFREALDLLKRMADELRAARQVPCLKCQAEMEEEKAKGRKP